MQQLKKLENFFLTNGYTFSEDTHKLFNSMSELEKDKFDSFIYDLISVSKADGYVSGFEEAKEMYSN